MDIQLKRGMLDVCVLAAIKDEDSYGYQIIKDMKPYVTISESTLYPILRRLEAGAAHGSFRGAQRKTQKVLSYYRCRKSQDRRVQGRVEGTGIHIQIYCEGGSQR